MIPATTQRVRLHTGDPLNQEIDSRIHESVAFHATATPEATDRRLKELDFEWDIERVMGVVMSSAVLLGVALTSVSPWWQILTAAAAACLLSHSLFGWWPLLPVFRWFGLRTPSEINHERYALKVLRGDFQTLPNFTTPDEREALARLEGEGGICFDDDALPDAADLHVVQQALEVAKK
jgi:hypothetical protein